LSRKMAKKPQKPVLPPPPAVGPGTVAPAPIIDATAPVDPLVPDSWFTDFDQGEPAPSLVETQTADVDREAASNDAGAPVDAPKTDEIDDAIEAEPIEEVAVVVATSAASESSGAAAPPPPVVEAKPLGAAPPLRGEAGGTVLPGAVPPPGMDAQQKLMTRLVAGGIAVVAVVAIAIRCAAVPSSTATKGDAVARAGGSNVEGSKIADDPTALARAGASDNAGGGGNAGGGDNAGGGGNAGDGGNASAGDNAGGNAGAGDDAAADGNAGGGSNGDSAAKDGSADGNVDSIDDARKDGAAASDPAAAEEDDDVRVDDAAEARSDKPTSAEGGNAGSSSSSSSKSGGSRTDDAAAASTRSAEQSMTADELLELARKAWKAGNARDTLKYANKSRYKDPSAEASELATLAACKMKLDAAAKTSYKDLSGDRRKRVRNQCRDMGVRVGL
jgi:hypothetical protein